MTWGRLALAAVVVASLGTSGCFSRQLLGFQTHPDKDVMLMETFESHDYFFWSSHEHVYWSCNESGQALQCTRRCGGDTDLVCPEAAIFAYGAGTNVR